MDVSEFREIIAPGVKLAVGGKEFSVREVVKFRFDDGGFYIKCFLSDDYVFADDLNENSFLLVKEIKTPFDKPFPEELEFDGKRLKFLFTAHAKAEKIYGEEIFKEGESEWFWDYAADDGSYLSLGTVESTNERLDFYGKIINNDSLEIKYN